MQYAIYAYETGRLVLADSQPDGAYLCVSGARERLQQALDKFADRSLEGNWYDVKRTGAWVDAMLAEDELVQAFECHNAIQDFTARTRRFLETQ